MYLEKLKLAFERNLRLNLDTPEFRVESNRYINSEFIKKTPSLLYEELGAIDIEYIFKNCMGLHYQMKPIFEEYLNTEIYYTLGNVSINNQYIFKITEEQIVYLLNNKIEKPLNIHAWLTLPSMEILDFSFSTTYSILKNIEEGMGAAITKHYSELTNGLKYEPMLIGEDFLKKSGGLIFI